ncbi:MAG: HAMP domain-containing histidine kinase [Anaerolineae bacterium]|nr:HAMP domain-containing histidine kinase [Anaerolineae bacterium]
MRSLRIRLILSHVLPLLVALPLVGIALTYLLETQVLLAGLSNELERQALLVADVADDYPQIWFDTLQARAFVARMDPYLSARMMLIAPDGTLLASTDPGDDGRLGQSLVIPGFQEVLRTGAILRVDYGEQPGAGEAEVLVPVIALNRVIGVIRLTDPLASVYARFPQTRTLIIGVLVGGLVLGLGVGLFLALNLERPLKRSTEAIVRMTNGKHLEQLPEQGPREYRLLQQAFNTLAAQLQNLEKSRQRLLANLVHEIGRPLGALRSAIQALAGGAVAKPDLRQELLSGMDAEVVRMQHLLDDLTQLYGQALGSLELERRETEALPWLQEVLAPWREAALQKDLRWYADLPYTLPVVRFDPDRVAQALGNVLSNAIKYTAPGDSVTVGAGVEGDALWIRVADTGPGITPEEQARIFEPFYRGPANRRFPQGMGLGLSIARDLMVAHGGRIDVASRVGAGSAFTLYLPLAAT